MDIAVINQADELKGRDNDIAWMMWAWAVQLIQDVTPVWGYQPVKFSAYNDPSQVPAGALHMLLVSTPDVANALGYHDVDPQGNPFIKVFTGPIFQNGGTPREGSNSVSMTGSHELLELYGDAGANLWATDTNGVAHALELSDAVEQYGYNKSYGGVNTTVSNFLTPQWFRSVPQNKQLDFMNLCTDPFQILQGGYDIYMQGGQVKQNFGREYWDWKKPLKFHSMSRTAKRMVHAHKILASMQKVA